MDIKSYVKRVYDHNEKSGSKDVHKQFLNEYKKLMKETSELKGDCSIGDYCGLGGCYRYMACTFQDAYPKSKELAIKLGKYVDNTKSK